MQHYKICTCEDVVTVFQKCCAKKKSEKKKNMKCKQSIPFSALSIAATSVDLAPFLKKGFLSYGEYDMTVVQICPA